jgi:hypothetical protein
MCEKELLVAYLYDDLSDGDRATFESHLRGCAACRDELTSLRGVRVDLAVWAPPLPDFGFRVVRGGRAAEGAVAAAVSRPVPSWRAWWTPAAVLAAASALAHVEVRRGPDGLTVRTGWSAAVPASSGSERGGRPAPPGQDIRLAAASPADVAVLAAIERRLNALETASHDSGVRNASTLTARSSDADILQRVREILAQSETRQQDQLALRIAQVLHDVDAQRVADLTTIQKGFRGIEASVTAEAAGHRELTNYILTSAKRE